MNNSKSNSPLARAPYAASHPFYQLLALAQQGNPGAQYQLGRLYYLGNGTVITTPNLLEACKWLEAAAKQGHAPAQYDLAKLYGKGGEGILKNNVWACYWLDLAAAQAYSPALLAKEKLRRLSQALNQPNQATLTSTPKVPAKRALSSPPSLTIKRPRPPVPLFHESPLSPPVARVKP